MDIIDFIRKQADDLRDLKLALTRRTSPEILIPPFSPGWANYAPIWRPLSLYKISGMVILMGMIYHPGVVGAQTVITEIPPGWRPAYQDLQYKGSDLGSIRIDITAAGLLIWGGGTGSAVGWIDVSGYTWPAEQ